mmetsp:Transcript_23953/g.59213  ORF Transcript_23953/g.59213 Transcript_23953/m.59213 type:complete len:238 (-) Transcript_23953:140-853(-)
MVLRAVLMLSKLSCDGGGTGTKASNVYLAFTRFRKVPMKCNRDDLKKLSTKPGSVASSRPLDGRGFTARLAPAAPAPAPAAARGGGGGRGPPMLTDLQEGFLRNTRRKVNMQQGSKGAHIGGPRDVESIDLAAEEDAECAPAVPPSAFSPRVSVAAGATAGGSGGAACAQPSVPPARRYHHLVDVYVKQGSSALRFQTAAEEAIMGCETLDDIRRDMPYDDDVWRAVLSLAKRLGRS